MARCDNTEQATQRELEKRLSTNRIWDSYPVYIQSMGEFLLRKNRYTSGNRTKRPANNDKEIAECENALFAFITQPCQVYQLCDASMNDGWLDFSYTKFEADVLLMWNIPRLLPIQPLPTLVCPTNLHKSIKRSSGKKTCHVANQFITRLSILDILLYSADYSKPFSRRAVPWSHNYSVRLWGYSIIRMGNNSCFI